MTDIRQAAFDIVDRLRCASSRLDVYRELQVSQKYFGYEAFLIASLPNSEQQDLSDCKLLSKWPAEWERRYQAKRYIHVDPVIDQIRYATDPFLWREAANARNAKAGLIVFEEARTFGLNDGFCVPFHRLNRTEAGVSFGGARFTLSNDQRAALHLVALYAMSSLKAIARKEPKPDQRVKGKNSLSAREIECLKWTADGKTAWEISMILSLSNRTVEKYLCEAATKLGAVNRVQCVAEALRRGIIP